MSPQKTYYTYFFAVAKKSARLCLQSESSGENRGIFHLNELLYAVHALQEQEARTEKLVYCPIADPGKAELLHQLEPGLDASHILKPDHMPLACAVGIGEEGRLGGLVEFDVRARRDCQIQRRRVGDHPGRVPLLPGQVPVVAVVGKAHENLSRGDPGHRVFQNAPDPVHRGHSLGRAVGIAPFI